MTTATTKIDNLVEMIRDACCALAAGVATYKDYKKVYGTLIHCENFSQNNPNLGFSEEIFLIKHQLKNVLNRVNPNKTNPELKWTSPFLTIEEIASVAYLLFLFQEQFCGKPKLEKGSNYCLDDNFIMQLLRIRIPGYYCFPRM